MLCLDTDIRLCFNFFMIETYVKKFPKKADFCRAFGIKHQYLNQIEDGSRPIPPKLCNALEKYFGADKKILRPDIFGEPNPDPEINQDTDA